MSIITWVTDLISKIPHALRQLAEQALGITRKLENVLDSGEVHLLETLIPGDWDNNAVDKAKTWLESVDKFIEQIPTLFPDPHHQELARNMVLQKTQSYFTALPDGEKQKESEYDKAAQLVYAKHD